jgi:3-deoxy-D-manno-octulosonic-acid transferase
MKPRLPADACIALFFYNLLFLPALLFMLPGLVLRLVRRGNYRFRFGQRFGIYAPDVRQRLGGQRRVWIQSISVGETMVALKLARKMRDLAPETRFVVSVTTSTGFALAREAGREWLEAIYTPLDFPPFVNRALALIQPRQLVVIEGMWVNLAAAARRSGARLAMVARLSPRSERRFRRFRPVSGCAFRLFDRILVQEEADIERWTAIGATRDSVRRVGGIKFDISSSGDSRETEFRALLAQLGVTPETPTLLGGSTFPGEEKILADILLSLRADFPRLFLVLVPRHVERSGEILAELRPTGLAVALRSEIAAAPQPCDVLLVNTTGELRDWYRTATVAFVGKSITGIGGQNPVEPALAGIPVLFGPHMENFTAVVRPLLEAGAAVQSADTVRLQDEIRALLSDPQHRRTMASAAHHALDSHQGATERAALLLLQL